MASAMSKMDPFWTIPFSEIGRIENGEGESKPTSYDNVSPVGQADGKFVVCQADQPYGERIADYLRFMNFYFFQDGSVVRLPEKARLHDHNDDT